MPGTYSQLLLHIVTSTKGRTPWISPSVVERLDPYIGALSELKRAFCTRSAVSRTTCTFTSGGGRTAACRT